MYGHKLVCGRNICKIGIIFLNNMNISFVINPFQEYTLYYKRGVTWAYILSRDPSASDRMRNI